MGCGITKYIFKISLPYVALPLSWFYGYMAGQNGQKVQTLLKLVKNTKNDVNLRPKGCHSPKLGYRWIEICLNILTIVMFDYNAGFYG